MSHDALPSANTNIVTICHMMHYLNADTKYSCTKGHTILMLTLIPCYNMSQEGMNYYMLNIESP